MKTLKLITATIGLSTLLFSCQKDNESLETSSANTDLNSVTLAMDLESNSTLERSKDNFPCTGSVKYIKPMFVKVDPSKLSESTVKKLKKGEIHISYMGYSHDEVDFNSKTRRAVKKSKKIKQENQNGKFFRYSDGTFGRLLFLASYGKADRGYKYNYGLYDTKTNRRMHMQHPVWGSCSGKQFAKNITFLLKDWEKKNGK